MLHLFHCYLSRSSSRQHQRKSLINYQISITLGQASDHTSHSLFHILIQLHFITWLRFQNRYGKKALAMNELPLYSTETPLLCALPVSYSSCLCQIICLLLKSCYNELTSPTLLGSNHPTTAKPPPKPWCHWLSPASYCRCAPTSCGVKSLTKWVIGSQWPPYSTFGVIFYLEVSYGIHVVSDWGF